MHDYTHFEWDEAKNVYNQKVHGVSFELATSVYDDPNMIIVEDTKHSQSEDRFYCIGMVKDQVMMVRFTIRGLKVRIFGAGYWHQGKKIYEKTNKIH